MNDEPGAMPWAFCAMMFEMTMGRRFVGLGLYDRKELQSTEEYWQKMIGLTFQGIYDSAVEYVVKYEGILSFLQAM